MKNVSATDVNKIQFEEKKYSSHIVSNVRKEKNQKPKTPQKNPHILNQKKQEF
jgi:hypothetical protein